MAISPQRLTICLYSAHRAVVFAIAQLSCFTNHLLCTCRLSVRRSVCVRHLQKTTYNTYKSSEVLLKLYKTLVPPHVEYSVSAWSPYYVKDKTLLERIQHRFTRMVPGLKSLPYEERLDRLGIWTLEERRNRADLLQVFKLYKGWSIIYSIWSLLHCQYCYEH